MPVSVLLDCDPGIDDALAIALLLGTPDVDLIGITTVAGNVALETTTANALRHGQARRVSIRLVQAGPHRRLSIRDDGQGCDPAALSGADAGLGIRSMRARAEAVQGCLDVQAPPGRGLHVRVTWPASATAAPDPSPA